MTLTAHDTTAELASSKLCCNLLKVSRRPGEHQRESSISSMSIKVVCGQATAIFIFSYHRDSGQMF
jgi:hypothetical protein